MKSTVKNDLTQKYSKSTILIHWISAVLILVLFGLGLSMEDADAIEKMKLIKFHAPLGLLLFILTLIRSILFFKSPRPDDIKTGSKFNDKIAVWIHNAFYIILILISISGIVVMFQAGFSDALQTADPSKISDKDLPSLKAHGTMSFILIGLVVLHIIGVIKHYILTKENTLKRII